MKNFFKPILWLFVLAIFATSCSKEKRLEKRLDGTWKIDELIETSYRDGVPTTYPPIGITGSIVLNKDKTGMITINDGGDLEATLISNWTNTENTVTLTLSDIGYTEVLMFDIALNEKKKQEWINYDPNKTDPDRYEVKLKLSAQK